MADVEVSRAPDGTVASGGTVLFTRSRVAALGLALAASWLPVLAFRGAVTDAARLREIALGAHPYFAPGHAFLLYILAPLVIVSAISLLLSPGLLLAAAFDLGDTVARWVLHGFVLSLVAVSVATSAIQAVLGSPLTGLEFAAIVGALSAGASALLYARARGRRPPRWPLADPGAATTLLSMALAPALFAAALAPKLYWESFNGDGAHAFESARLLLTRPFPFWDPAAGEIASFPGITSVLFAYPASWFIRLFGPIEASARLPLLLYLPPLFGAIVALVHRGAPRRETARSWLIWLALAVYVVTVSYSATYSPYSADMALPATQDTLLVVCFLGFALAWSTARWAWMTGFALLTCLSLPNGLLLLGFWLVATLLAWRPIAWGPAVRVAGAIVLCMGVAALAAPLLAALGAPAPGGEYGAAGLLRRFAFLQVTDVRRLAYLIVPCGILPAAALLAWRRQDPLARTFTLVTAAAFLFAFVQAHAPLHYYIPAMLLPLVVFWRIDSAQPRVRTLVTAIAGVAALGLALPGNGRPFMDARAVGLTIEERVGDYATSDPAVFRASTLLHEIIPYDWEPEVPDERLGGSPLVFNFYAHEAGSRPAPNYVVARVGDPSPPGMRAAAGDDEFVVWVRSERLWREQLALRPPTPAGSPVFQMPRGILFRSVALRGGPWIIDLPAIAGKLGIDVDALAGRARADRVERN